MYRKIVLVLLLIAGDALCQMSERVSPKNFSYIDPEIYNPGSMLSFQLGSGDIWIGELDPLTGLFKSANGLDYKMDENAAPPITQQELERGWYWGNQEQKKPGTPNDWVFEEAGRSSCWHKPGGKRCGQDSQQQGTNFKYKGKLFGAITTDFTRGQTTIDFLNELEVNFVNFRMTFAWEKIEPQKGEFDWEEADEVVNLAYENGISLMPMIFSARGVMGGDAGGYSSTYGVPHGSNIGINDEDIDGYRNFVYQTVNRYKDKIKYWQFWEEAPSQARDDPEGYAQAFQITYEEIKRADPEAKVVIGQFLVNPDGTAKSKTYFEKVFNYLGQGHYFDVFEFLSSPPDNDKEGYKDIKSIGSEIREFINQYGYSDIPLFFSTTAGTNTLTENEQAEQIIRLYTAGASSNLFSRIMWDELYGCWSVGGVSMERGLVYCTSAKKKLGYYTYKLMSEKLEGSDWGNVEPIQESDNVYVYKFTNQDRHIWVVWWDYFNDSTYVEGDTMIVKLAIEDADSVIITQAVPDAESGADLDEEDYPAFFATKIKQVIAGTVTIALDENPVFVEGLSSATPVEDENSSLIPKDFYLGQNYPNPFNPVTTIRFSLPERTHLTLKVFDVLGRVVATLVDGEFDPGEHSVIYNVTDLPSGVYVYRLAAGTFIQQKKMEVIK